MYWDKLAKSLADKSLVETIESRNIPQRNLMLFNKLLPAKVLTRNFIHNSLYNPHYGYFTKNAKIFNRPSIDFNTLKSSIHFTDLIAQMYQNLGQVWHTPTELFNVYLFDIAVVWSSNS